MPRRSPSRRLDVTMLLYGDVESDPRVLRETDTLVGAGHRVTVATLAMAPRRPFRLGGATVVPVRPSRRGLVPGDSSPFRTGEGNGGGGHRWVAGARWGFGYSATFAYWARAAMRRLPPADVWHGHDLLGLALGWSLRRRHGGALIHDSHELYLEAGSASRLPGPARILLASIEGRLSRSADAVITVNDSIARELHRRYRVEPVVIMNCPPLSDEHTAPVLRERLELGTRPVVIHHGVLGPGRGIEQLIAALPQLPSGTAVVLLGRGPLTDQLVSIASRPDLVGRLYIVPAVPPSEVAAWVEDADVGVIPFQAISLNNMLATPNKLFEYMAAGVPVVVSDFPEMRRIVDETGAGVAADAADPAKLGAAVRRLLEEPAAERAQRRAAARRAAVRSYNWHAQEPKLLRIYTDLAASTRLPTDSDA